MAVALARTRIDLRVIGDAEERRADLRADALNHGAPWLARIANEGNAGLGDAGLVARDLLERLAQDIGMVEADVGDDRNIRRDEVRPVERTADADLDHGDVDLRDLEGNKREREQGLVVRRPPHLARRRFDCRAHRFQHAGELFFGERPPVDARTFRHRGEMRFGVQPRSLSRGGQRRGEHRRSRAFAARAADVQGPVPQLRLAEMPQQRGHPLET